VLFKVLVDLSIVEIYIQRDICLTFKHAFVKLYYLEICFRMTYHHTS